jgi:hypothetical protein
MGFDISNISKFIFNMELWAQWCHYINHTHGVNSFSFLQRCHQEVRVLTFGALAPGNSKFLS